MKRLLLPLLALAMLATQAAAEVKITGPADPVAPGEYVQLTVSGVADAALPTGKLVLWPREKTTLLPARTWTGEAIVLFSAKSAGKYLLALSVPKDGKIEYAEIVVTVGDPPPPPPPPPDQNPWQPAQQYQALVRPVINLRLGRADATSLAGLYGSLARDVAGGPAAIETTADLRKVLVERGSKLALKGRYAGLAEAVDQVLAKTLGLDVVALNKPEAAALLATLAWAVWETGKGGAP
jgi:hypothetical protein